MNSNSLNTTPRSSTPWSPSPHFDEIRRKLASDDVPTRREGAYEAFQTYRPYLESILGIYPNAKDRQILPTGDSKSGMPSEALLRLLKRVDGGQIKFEDIDYGNGHVQSGETLLKAYLGTICRNLQIDTFARSRDAKANAKAISIDEWEQIVGNDETPSSIAIEQEKQVVFAAKIEQIRDYLTEKQKRHLEMIRFEGKTWNDVAMEELGFQPVDSQQLEKTKRRLRIGMFRALRAIRDIITPPAGWSSMGDTQDPNNESDQV